MIDAAYCEAMARYGRWMNDKLFELCAEISDAERKRDRGAFFGSIHRTLDHILYGDLTWLSRFEERAIDLPTLDVQLHASFDALRDARRELDERMLMWARQVSGEWLEAPVRFTSQTDGVTREHPNWMLVVHMFNHATHHRGQVTTLLKQLGYDPGDTDLHKHPGLGQVIA